jgi:hypothetical protein
MMGPIKDIGLKLIESLGELIKQATRIANALERIATIEEQAFGIYKDDNP